MAARRVLLVLGILVVAMLIASDASAACKTCSRGLCQTAAGGWAQCRATQNTSGTWTCTLSGSDDCSSNRGGGGETCTNPGGNVCHWIFVTVPPTVECEPSQFVCTGGAGERNTCSANTFPCPR